MPSANCCPRRLLVSWRLATARLGAGTSIGFASLPPGDVLVWSDEFDGPDAKLDLKWEAQNGPGTHLLGSRWRENEICLSLAPVWLSLAVIPWADRVTDATDGQAMEVDYVRAFYQKP